MSESFDEDDAGYGSEDASYVDQAGIAEEAAATTLDIKHISTDELTGIQTHLIVLSMEASPARANRTPALCMSSLADKVQSSFHTINAVNDRHNPQEKDLEGELNRLVVTNLRCIGYINQSLQPICVDIAGHVPMTLTTSDRTNLLLESAPTFVAYPMNIHNPNNFMTKDMLKIWERCDDTVLKKEFNYVDNGAEKICLVHTKGVAAKLLERMPQKFDNYKMPRAVERTSFAPVDAAIAERLHTYMSDTINRISKSFVSPSDIKAAFRPSTGDWCNTQAFTGDAATLTYNKMVQHNERILQKQNRIAVHLMMDSLPIAKAYKE